MRLNLIHGLLVQLQIGLVNKEVSIVEGKKMNDTIYREDAIEAVSLSCRTCLARNAEDCEKCSVPKLRELINVIPSANRSQGEWIEKNNGYDTTCECSVCHYRNFIPNYQVGSKYVCMDRYWFKRNFCPSCGARMKGADDESS